MVSIQTAKGILATQRSQVASQRQQIQQTGLPQLTRAQVEVQSRQSIILRQRQETDLASAKTRELAKLQPIERQIEAFAGRISAIDKQQADLDVARRLFFTGGSPAGQSPGVRKFFREFTTEREAQVEQALKDVVVPRFTPLPEPGQLFTPLPTAPFTPLPVISTPLPVVPRFTPVPTAPIFTPIPREDIIRFTPLSPSELISRPRDPSFIDRLSRIIPLGLGVPGIPGTTEARPIRELITEPGFTFLQNELGISKQDIVKLGTLSDRQIDISFAPLPKVAKDKIKDAAQILKNIQVGILKGIEEKPEQIVSLTAASTLLPRAIALTGEAKIVKNLFNRVPQSVKKRGTQAIQAALGGLYLTASGLDVAAEPTPELKQQKVGRILSTEVSPFILGTRLGVKSLLRKEIQKELDVELNKLSPKKRIEFEEYVRQTELLGRFEPDTKNIRLDNIKAFQDPRAQRELRSFLRGNKDEVTVGGSVAQTGQIKVQRQLGDVDLYLEGKLNPTQAAQILAKRLVDAGVGRVSQVGRVVTIEGKKAVEFHNIDRLLANIKQVTPFYKNPRNYIIKTPEGIKIQRLALQAKRKLVAAFADPRRLATGKFRQDLRDFKKISEVLFRRAELNARRSFFFRESKIKQLEKEFGVSISRKPVTIKKFIKPPKLKPVGEGVRGGPPRPKKISLKPKKFRTSPILQRAKLKARAKPFARLRPSQARSIRTRTIRLRPSQPFRKLKRAPPSQFTPIKFRRPPIFPPPSQLPPRPPRRKPPLVPPGVPPSQPPGFPPRRPPLLVPPKFPGAKPPVVPPIAPPPKKITAIPPEKLLKKKLSKPFREAKSFDILVRRKGKFVTARRSLPFNLAIKTGANLIDKNLRATFRLRPSQKTALKSEISRPKLSFKQFRRPKKTSPLFKKNTLTIIERRSKRLSTRTEVGDIQRVRKVKLKSSPMLR